MCLANVVLDYIAKNNGVYVPLRLRKGTIVCFHVENLNFADYTKDRKGTTHTR